VVQGRNDFGRVRYEGPCPEWDVVHHYTFQLYALDERTGLPPGAARQQVLDRIEEHVLARTELLGRIAYYQQMEDIRARQREAQERLGELRQASGRAWGQLQTGVDRALDDLREAVDDAAENFA